ncbi:RloB family protein [Glycomyces buryatensis]|nr:RloB family protein [Glycomyces buryatensis]
MSTPVHCWTSSSGTAGRHPPVKHHRQPKGRRRTPAREPAPQVLIVVCGQRTEKEYFEDFKQCGTPNISIKVKVKDKSPLKQVEYTADLRDAGGFTQVWCVLDVDHFANLEQALIEAKRRRVAIAISNPCFEYWLLLHFEDCARPFASPSSVKEYLQRRHVPGYDKDSPCLEAFRPRRREAIDRGRKREAASDGHLCNPSTTVWRLVELILDEQDKRRR